MGLPFLHIHTAIGSTSWYVGMYGTTSDKGRYPIINHHFRVVRRTGTIKTNKHTLFAVFPDYCGLMPINP